MAQMPGDLRLLGFVPREVSALSQEGHQLMDWKPLSCLVECCTWFLTVSYGESTSGALAPSGIRVPWMPSLKALDSLTSTFLSVDVYIRATAVPYNQGLWEGWSAVQG